MSGSSFCGRILSFILLASLMIASGTVLAQNTINVPADQPTIQAGINAANNGDTVLVAPGTYVENLNFNGKAITVTSSGGAAVTIVDGNATAPVATFVTNEGTSSVLNGFTLRNGVPLNGPPIFFFGGGIVIYQASPTITNNVITGNHAVCGVGIEAEGSSAVIRGNTITGNTQAGGDGGCGGGGIEVGGGAPQIIGNTITNNSLAAGGFGGGIEVNDGSPTIQNNYIAGNSVYNSGGGINIVNGGTSVVVQNIIVNNSAGGGGSGGGISIVTPAEETAVIVNNTIVGNTAFSDNTSGLYAGVLGPATISNNIVVATPGQNAIVCEPISTFPVFSHNDVVASNGGQAWSSNCASFATSNGNISEDPQFVNAANGNYHLQAGSPVVDAGDNAAPNLSQQDYDGNPRVLDGNNDCVSTVDLGVYELPGGAATVAFSPTSLGFFTQLIGTTSPGQTATLTNSGTGCFRFSGTQITGDFSEVNTCAAAGLPGGSSCGYVVSFTPTASGARTGMLTVTGSDGVTSSSPTVTLSGTGGTPPAVSLSATTLNFGVQPLQTGGTQPITLTNTGSGPLNILNIGTTAPFSEINNCPQPLGGGFSCIIMVSFTPSVTGTQSALLTINDNAAGSPQTVALSGTGVDFSLSASPTSVSVKRGSSVQLNIAVAPVGGSFNSNVNLVCDGLPPLTSCSFSPAGVVPGSSGSSSVLTISTTTKAEHGTINISVDGISGPLLHSTRVTLTVR